jgi:hypothetical protein
MVIIEKSNSQMQYECCTWGPARRGANDPVVSEEVFSVNFFLHAVCLVLSAYPHSSSQQWPKQKRQRLPRSSPVSKPLRSSLFVAYSLNHCSRLLDGWCVCCKFCSDLSARICFADSAFVCRLSRRRLLLPSSVSSSWCRTRMKWSVLFVCCIPGH